MDDRFSTEITSLQRLKVLLDKDTTLPIRFELERMSLDFRRFRLAFRGIQSIVKNPSLGSDATASVFTVEVQVSSGYPWSQIPQIKFLPPVPFHPHVWSDGRICWGTNNEAMPDLSLADWTRGVIEYLLYNQDGGSLLRINPDSPANREALAWYQRNRGRITTYVPSQDLGRLRTWIDRCRG
jgi:ubiquitin-protein ligase